MKKKHGLPFHGIIGLKTKNGKRPEPVRGTRSIKACVYKVQCKPVVFQLSIQENFPSNMIIFCV